MIVFRTTVKNGFRGARNPSSCWLASVLLGSFLASVSVANHSFAEETVDFNRDIRPLFSANCFTCHGPDDQKREADLRLDSQQGSRADLGGYAAIVPGDPDASELMTRLITEDEDLRMPPEGKGKRLTGAEVDRIGRWIEQGAELCKALVV